MCILSEKYSIKFLENISSLQRLMFLWHRDKREIYVFALGPVIDSFKIQVIQSDH